MKRVLFVDDEPPVLEGLRKMLQPQNNQWEMAFAPDGEAALTLLEAAPFDVVVADLRMPKMDGAALLKTACDRFPGIVRIILASQRDLDNALRAVPVAHQFLLKPCDPNMLRVAIERATRLKDLLNNKLLASTVGSVQDLPVLPRTYLGLRQALADPEVPLRKVVQIVEQDVAVSAKILQMVNSAFFGLPREITTLQTAVSFLGTHMLQNLVLSAEVFRVLEKAKSPRGFSFEELHMHSQLVAKIAGRIPAPPHARDAAIVAGLLHDAGKLVLATRSAQHFARALEGARLDRRPLFAVEQALIGVSHAEVGAYLLGLWGLPSPVVEAVAHHHQPNRIPHEDLDAVGIVHIANALAHEHPVYPPVGEPLPQQAIDADYLQAVGMADQVAAWGELAEAAANELREAAGSLA